MFHRSGNLEIYVLLKLLLFMGANFVQTFNIDTNSATRVVHRCSTTNPKCPKNSMFGYDVDMYKNSNTNDLLIGAPRDQTDQPNITEGGSVYRCNSEPANCARIPFDTQGNGKERGSPNESKSNQWFGAFVSSSRHKGDDSVIACAPRYIWIRTISGQEMPIGNCIVAKDGFRTKLTFSPFKTYPIVNNDVFMYGYSTSGFSAAIGNDNNVFISAPSAYSWTGSIISQHVEQNGRFTHTKENPKEHESQMLGYATATGEFNGDTSDDVVVGVPRGNSLSGMIALYDNTLKNLLNITGDQIGSYFGAAIAVSDLNGDGLDDIIVGAPLYTKMEPSSAGVKMSYEIGKVYVYFQDDRHKFDKSISVFGQTEWSKFGYDVADAGDLNLDGFNDFLVGAPYDTKNGEFNKRNGAIYIFNGGKHGIYEKFSQVIYGQSIESNIETFGFSVAGGKDTDNNGYPDILVGAYKSNVAVLLKSRPVASMKSELRLRPETIKLENKTCKNNGQMVACGVVSVCLTYRGQGLPDDLSIHFILKYQKTFKWNHSSKNPFPKNPF